MEVYVLNSSDRLHVCLQVRPHATSVNITIQDLERSAETAAHALAAFPSCKELKITCEDSTSPSWQPRLNMALSCAAAVLHYVVSVTVHYGDNLIW